MNEGEMRQKITLQTLVKELGVWKVATVEKVGQTIEITLSVDKTENASGLPLEVDKAVASEIARTSTASQAVYVYQLQQQKMQTL